MCESLTGARVFVTNMSCLWWLEVVARAFIFMLGYAPSVREGSVMTDKTLQGILGKLRHAVADAKAVYFAFGDAMIQLRSHAYSWEAAREVITSAFPDIQASTGLNLTLAWLRGAHDMASTFLADGGLVSPDGKHRVTREDVSELNLNAKGREKLTDLLAYSASNAHAKGTPKLRVSDVASAVRAAKAAKTPGEKRQAVRKFMDKMDAVDGSMNAVESEDEAAILASQLAVIESQVTATRDRLAKLEVKRFELRQTLAALALAAESKAASEAASEADVSKLVAAKGGKRRPRPATASVTAEARS